MKEGEPVRRKDREVTDPKRIDEIIQSCDCARLGLSDGDAAYIVPLNFAYVRMGGTPTFYFHCAHEGRKLMLLARNPHAGFELDTAHALHPGDAGCDFSFAFQSVIGTGTVAAVTDPAEKKEALRRIVSHYSDREAWEFTAAQAASVTVLRLTMEEMACKEHL